MNTFASMLEFPPRITAAASGCYSDAWASAELGLLGVFSILWNVSLCVTSGWLPDVQ
jgi:hypothetical protein